MLKALFQQLPKVHLYRSHITWRNSRKTSHWNYNQRVVTVAVVEPAYAVLLIRPLSG